MIEDRRKFQNPTAGWVGAIQYDDDGKRKAIPVAPGGYVWLSEREERATAEAPARPEDNPFVAEWDAIVGHDPLGDPITERRTGMLVLTDAQARPIASDRYTPSDAARQAESEEETVTGAPPVPQSEPEVGTPAENEIVATPEAVPANDREKAARAAREEPTPVTDRPQGADVIATPASHHPLTI